MPLQPLAQLISKQCRCHSQLVSMDETAAVPCRIPSAAAAAAYLLCVGACSCCTVASRGLRTTPTSSLALLLRTYHLVGGARNQLVNPHSRQWLVAVPRSLHSAHHTACKRMCWLLAWCHSQIGAFRDGDMQGCPTHMCWAGRGSTFAAAAVGWCWIRSRCCSCRNLTLLLLLLLPVACWWWS